MRPETDFGRVQEWLVERVTFHLRRPAEGVDPEVPLVTLGFDSVRSLTLCGDVEDHYGCVFEPSVTWDHPTINALALHILTVLGEER